LAGWN